MNIQSVPAGRGWKWIVAAFNLFKKNPLIWIVLHLILILIGVGLSFVPMIGPYCIPMAECPSMRRLAEKKAEKIPRSRVVTPEIEKDIVKILGSIGREVRAVRKGGLQKMATSGIPLSMILKF